MTRRAIIKQRLSRCRRSADPTVLGQQDAVLLPEPQNPFAVGTDNAIEYDRAFSRTRDILEKPLPGGGPRKLPHFEEIPPGLRLVTKKRRISQ